MSGSKDVKQLALKEILGDPHLRSLLELYADRVEDAWRAARYNNYKYAKKMMNIIPPNMQEAAIVYENNRRFRT